MLRSLYKLLGGLLTLFSATAAMAKVDLKVDVGWNGAYRAGRWAPVYITAADDTAQPARNVMIEIVAPHDKTFALRIFNPATIRPEPTTILIYVPLTIELDNTSVILRDLSSRKILAETRFENPQNSYARGGMNYYSGNSDILLGVSGNAQHGLGVLKAPFKWLDESTPTVQPGQPVQQPPNMDIGYLEPRLLPDAKVGYECLNALILAAPDLVNIDEQRQNAIATWVRGGGRLIFLPSDGVIPDSPIARLLPCEFGNPETLSLSLADTRAAGLASRVEKLSARRLTPSPEAQKLDLLGGKGAAYFNRAGMGQVAVLSFDASKLIFTDSISARKFWRPIFHRTLKPRDDKPQPNYYGYGSAYDPTEARRLAATEHIIDRLGNVPGVGRFDFSYVALVMIGMMLIVGPIDWWVLRKLGRQEWTWVTTSGWIALVTFSALYVGHVLKSGDLYYRTVRVIDQADGKVVGVLDVNGIYSPKTQAYNFDGPREGWWEPANVDFQNYYRQNQRTTSTIEMFQDRFGQRPATRFDSAGNRLPGMIINVWNLRFMQSELGDPADQPPMVSSALQVVKVGSEMRIRGTISNRAPLRLQNISIATKSGVARVFTAIESGATLPIDVAIEASTVKAVEISQYQPNYTYGANQQNPYASFGEELGFVVAATDMAADRAQRMLELLGTRDDLACIYGLMNDAQPAVKLEHEDKNAAKEQHWQVIRALVPLGK